MKIVIYSESFLPDLGGLERNTFTLANALLQLQHEVSVVTGTLQESTDNFSFPVVRTRSQKEITQAIAKVDVVIINGGISAKVCLPAFLYRKQYMVIYQMSTLYYRNGKSIKTRLGNAVRKFFAEKAFMNITVSKYAATQLNLRNPSIGVLINPIDQQLQGLAKSVQTGSKQFDILFAGRIIKGKGVFLLADACKELIGQGLALRVAIAGSGDEEEALKEYSKALQLNINFLGRLDKLALMQAYQASRTLIVPSSSHIEGSPLVIAEAISLHTPVIASDQPAMEEVIGKAGIVFQSGNSADLADKISRVFTNTSFLDELTMHCADEKEKFSYKSYIMTLQNFMNTLKNKQ